MRFTTRSWRASVLIGTALLAAFCGPRGRPVSAEPIDAAIIHDDEDITILRDGLLTFGDFGEIDLIPWSEAPDAERITSSDVVIVTNTHKPVANSQAWGNLVADYAEAGGGVVLGFAFFSEAGPAVNYGRLEDSGYSPFTRGGTISGTSRLGEVLVPGHPLMQGVNDLETAYRYDVEVNPGATLVAAFQEGYPLAGVMNVGAGRVVGIQCHYKEDPHFTNRGDFMQLYRNAAVYAVPEPSTILLLLTTGAVGLLAGAWRRRRRK